MRLPIVCALLLTIALGGCGVPDAGAPQGTDSTPVTATAYAATSAATPTFDQTVFQEQMDRLSNEATIVGATAVAVGFDPSADPAIATEAARHYQDTVATYTALQPTLMALTTPLAAPRISDAAHAAARAANVVDAANAAANAANMTPAPGQSADEVAMMQELTIVAATMVALNSGASVEPAVATEATRRYQDNIATITAQQPSPQPTPPPVLPAPTEPPPSSRRCPTSRRSLARPRPAHWRGQCFPPPAGRLRLCSAACPHRSPGTSVSALHQSGAASRGCWSCASESTC